MLQNYVKKLQNDAQKDTRLKTQGGDSGFGLVIGDWEILSFEFLVGSIRLCSGQVSRIKKE